MKKKEEEGKEEAKGRKKWKEGEGKEKSRRRKEK